MSDYRSTTDAEFEAHWAAQREQLRRVHRRSWLYALPLCILGIIALEGALLAAGVPLSPWTWPLFLLLGAAASKAGSAIAWHRAGGKPDYLR